MLEEEKLEQRIITANEESAKEIIKRILASEEKELKRNADRNDYLGKDCFEWCLFHETLIRKTLAGRGYELLNNNFNAGCSFDRSAQAAYKLSWHKITLLLNERAFENHLKTNEPKNQIISSSRIATNYFHLGDKEKAKEFLTKAHELASGFKYGLSECDHFKKINQKLGNIYLVD